MCPPTRNPSNPSKIPIPSLSPLARPLMLADLQKYRHKRSQATTSLPTTTTITSPPPSSRSTLHPLPPPRGTKRYCTWRCKSWKRARCVTAHDCECGFEHEICHPSEWRGTPAEAEWDYGDGMANGGYREREKKVRWQEPVGTVVRCGSEADERWSGKVEREWDWEMVEEDNGEIRGAAVDLGIDMGGVGGDPNEEMEDLFESLDLSVYRMIGSCTGAGTLIPGHSRGDSDIEGGLGDNANGVSRQFDLVRRPKIARGRARERLLDVVGREPGRFM